MLFHEIYSSYYNVVAKVLSMAVDGILTPKMITKVVQEMAFDESLLNVPDKLVGGEWNLLHEDMTTPILGYPVMPLSTLQKRWLKALLNDPRIKLFQPDISGLEEVEPLYSQEDIVYFDRYLDGDPYQDENYIRNFHIVLDALHKEQTISVEFMDRYNKSHYVEGLPCYIEFSSKDDKFRLILADKNEKRWIVNFARIKDCVIKDDASVDLPKEGHRLYVPENKKMVIVEVIDERNALQRILFDFSHLEKETERLTKDDTDQDASDEKRNKEKDNLKTKVNESESDIYRLTLYYDALDETEILIRLLSFGPMVKVIGPDSFIDLVKERLKMQKRF